MDYRIHCPSCGSSTSDLREAYFDELPCPHCGLAAEVICAVRDARAGHANDELKAKCEEALIRAGKLQAELDRAHRQLASIREVLGCEHE